jgi:hypothetical protein
VDKQYIERECYACEMKIMVISHDVSERYYCVTCAYAKLGATP